MGCTCPVNEKERINLLSSDILDLLPPVFGLAYFPTKGPKLELSDR